MLSSARDPRIEVEGLPSIAEIFVDDTKNDIVTHHLMTSGLSIVKHSTEEDAYLIALYQNCGI